MSRNRKAPALVRTGPAGNGTQVSARADLPTASPVDELTAPAGRRFSLRVVLALLAVTAGSVAFLLLWLLVQTEWPPLAALDGEVAAALNAEVSRSPLLVDVLQVVTDLGGTGTAVLVLSLTTAFLLIRRQARLAAFVLATGAGLAVLVPVTKAVIDRARPVVASPVVDTPGNASFPSGHAMTSLVTWGVLLLLALPAVHRRTRTWLIGATVLLVLAVGFTRLALGVHFVSDVLAGWGLGAAWLTVMALTFRRWQRESGRAAGEPLGPLALTPAEAPRPATGHGLLPVRRSILWRLGAGATACLVVLSALGMLVTGALTDTWLGRVDRGVVRFFVGLRTEARNDVAALVSDLAGTRTVIAVALALAVLVLAMTASWRPVLFVAATLAGEVLLYFLTAQVVDRLRPDVVDLTHGLPASASWPSGHAAAAAALYGALALLVIRYGRSRWRWAALALPCVVAPAVAVSRVYVAAHHPTDVLAGLVLGTVWLLICDRLLLSDVGQTERLGDDRAAGTHRLPAPPVATGRRTTPPGGRAVEPERVRSADQHTKGVP